MATRLGSSYTLESLVGRGGMGEVWRGHDEFGTVLAFKLLLPELTADERIVARFMRERSVLTRIQSPFVVQVWDLVAERGRLAIVMDFIEGSDLRRYLRSRGTLSPAEAVGLTVDVLTGLGVAHALGIVHRDLKPANILLSGDGQGLHPKVTDFGIAGVMDGSTELTTGQGVLGTPTYMAPEMIDGAEAGPPADVYAAGIMLYELLSGVTPFTGRVPLAVLRAHVDLAPGRPPGLDDALWAVLAAMLAKNPGDRPGVADLDALRSALEGLPAQPPLASPPPAVPTGPQPLTAGFPPPVPDPAVPDPAVPDPGVPTEARLSAWPPGPEPGRPGGPTAAASDTRAGGHRRRVAVLVAVVAVVLAVTVTALKITLTGGSDPVGQGKLAASHPGPLGPPSIGPSPAVNVPMPLTVPAAPAGTGSAPTAPTAPTAAGRAAGHRPAAGTAPGIAPGSGLVAPAPRPLGRGPTAGGPTPTATRTVLAAPPAAKAWVDAATGVCLDSGGGEVYTLGCNGGNYQLWVRDGRALRNFQTGNCLSSAAGGKAADGGKLQGSVYATACDGTPAQQWAGTSSTHFGTAFRNIGTGECLDSSLDKRAGTGYAAYTQDCNGGDYQSWT